MVAADQRLNPFEFRAGIYFAGLGAYDALGGLNPFEFRAGIYFKVGHWYQIGSAS